MFLIQLFSLYPFDRLIIENLLTLKIADVLQETHG